MIRTLIVLWNKTPTPLQKWLKGLEVTLITGLVSGAIAFPRADFTTRVGVGKFIGEFVGAVVVCVRLYMLKSPLQDVVKEVIVVPTPPAPEEIKK